MLTIDLFEKWTEKYKRSINCSNPKGFSQKAHCAGRKKHNESVSDQEHEFIQALRDFLPIAVKHLKIKNLPKIKLLRNVDTEHVPSFGKFSNEDRIVHVDIENRHPNDILRTLAHELTHYAQGEHGRLDSDSWQTGSPIEDEANAEAGVIMRDFNSKFPQYLKLSPIILSEALCVPINEDSMKYILYLNGKPVASYPSQAEAQRQGQMIKTKYPDSSFEIKQEVCKLNNLQLSENLRDWFKEKWVRFGPDGKIRGDCARGSSKEGKPKCLPQAKAHALGKKGRASAAAKKRREDPNPERSGPAKNVATKVREEHLDEKCWKGYHKEGNKKMFGKTVPNCVKNEDSEINEKKDACYNKVKSRYKVWPSAYASGALVQCRKKGAANWGNKSKK